MSTLTDTWRQRAGAGNPSSGVGAADRRNRDIQLREGFLPERRKLVTVLVRDPNTGLARCSVFPDVELAERFICTLIKVSGRQAFLAYWTLGAEPDLPQVSHGEAQAEVVVVSRSGQGLELVKPLAFPDMETARVYFESDRQREIAAVHASVFWALPLQIRRDGTGAVRLSSPFPSAVHETSEYLEQMRARVPLLNGNGEQDPGLAQAGGQIMPVRSVLSVERWPARARGEFRGFHSPPGRF